MNTLIGVLHTVFVFNSLGGISPSGDEQVPLSADFKHREDCVAVELEQVPREIVMLLLLIHRDQKILDDEVARIRSSGKDIGKRSNLAIIQAARYPEQHPQSEEMQKIGAMRKHIAMLKRLVQMLNEDYLSTHLRERVPHGRSVNIYYSEKKKCLVYAHIQTEPIRARSSTTDLGIPISDLLALSV